MIFINIITKINTCIMDKENILQTMSEVEYLRGENLILQAQNEYLMGRVIELYEEIMNKNEK